MNNEWLYGIAGTIIGGVIVGVILYLLQKHDNKMYRFDEENKKLRDEIEELNNKYSVDKRREKLLTSGEYISNGRNGYYSRQSDNAACCAKCLNNNAIISVLPNGRGRVAKGCVHNEKLVCPDCGAEYDNPNYDPKQTTDGSTG